MNDKFTASFERFDIELTEEQYLSGSHQGPCDDDIAALLELEEIKAQFNNITPDSIRSELSEYGAWDEVELSDDTANKNRILWVACGNIRDDVWYMENETLEDS